MASVSDCGELHNELCKLSDKDKLFAGVPLPCDVLIDVQEMDDTLLDTRSAVESAKVCYASLRLKDSTPTDGPGSQLDILQQSRRSLLGRNILYLSILKDHKLSRSACVERLVPSTGSQRGQLLMSILHTFCLPSKGSWHCPFVLTETVSHV